jgi:hypothetical protein
MDEELRKIIALQYVKAKLKFEKFTKAIEMLVKVKEVFGQELADKLYICFMCALCANPELTEDELIEKVLNDIKKD